MSVPVGEHPDQSNSFPHGDDEMIGADVRDEPLSQPQSAQSVRTLLSDGRTTLAQDKFLTAAIAACVITASVCTVLIAKLLDDVMGADDAAHADPRMTDWILDRRTDALTAFFRAATHLSDPWIVLVVVAFCSTALVLLRHPRLAGFLIASSLGTALMTTIAKSAVDRSRPPSALWLATASGAAFPSGHAAQSAACYGALAIVGCVLVRSSALRVLFLSLAGVVALSVGTSRVYLGVHWASDVLCGWSVATLWLALLVLVGWAWPRFASDRRDGREHVPRPPPRISTSRSALQGQ